MGRMAVNGTGRIQWTLLIALMSVLWTSSANAQLPTNRIQINGDLMIGVLADLTEFDASVGCNNTIDISAVEIVELVTFLLEKVNAANELPLKLGLTVYNDCDVDKYSLAQAVNFLNDQPLYIVVLCCKKSAPTEMVSQLTAAYQIPQISYASVLKDWTDSRVANYLLRTVAPKELQIDAIINILKYFKWSYVSVLYLADSFGERSMRRFEQLTKDGKICIAHSKRVLIDDDFQQIAKDLLHYQTKRARVVLLFIYSQQINDLFAELVKMKAEKKFIWLSIATWSYEADTPNEIKEIGLGGFSLKAALKQTPEVFNFLSHPGNISAIAKRNPWFSGYWEQCRCKWMASKENCSDVEIRSANEECGRYYYAASVYDAFYVIIEGLKNYSQSRNLSASDFDRAYFFQSMKNVHFKGISGNIDFDSDGDSLCEYKITQEQYENGKYVKRDIGSWSGRASSLMIAKPEWYVDEIFNGSVPPSICSFDCNPNEMKVQHQSVCCWECELCYANEILDSDECSECPVFQWPNQDFTSCIPIEPSFVTFDKWKGIIITSAAVVGVVLTTIVLILYIRSSHTKLIKASCREASFISLIGIGINFGTLIIFIGEPNIARCAAERFSFHLSFTLIYAPILIKVIKILRVFLLSKRSAQPPKFIGPKLQVGIIFLLIGIQAAVVGVLIGVIPVAVELRMADRRVRYVELLCEEPLPAFIVSTVINFILLLVCAIFGMKTRKLPQNYNESAYIAICCNTALILVAVYIPTYFTVERGGYKIIILCVTQTLNGIMALGLLYAPKLYAIYFVREDKIVYGSRLSNRRSTGACAFELERLNNVRRSST